jgi:hypothetical protein
LALPILKTFVLQVGQVPEVAGLPFFMVMALAFLISFLARHFTQYACMLHLLFKYEQYIILPQMSIGFNKNS